MSRRTQFGLVVLVAAILTAAALNSVYLVDQSHQAVVLRLGRPIAVINPNGTSEPGLKIKAPFVDRAILLDRRNQPLEADDIEVAAQDQAPLAIDGMMRFRIVDPLRFYRASGDAHGGGARLQDLLGSNLRAVLGGATSADILGAKRDLLMAQAQVQVAKAAHAAGLGVEVLDVRILRTRLPPSSAQAAYRRMQAVLSQQAAQTRTNGEQQNRDVMAEADKEAAIIRATADADASRIRGEGEARRAAIFADAYGRDPDFALFQRTMQSYQDSLSHGDTTFVLSSGSPYLQAFGAGPGPAR